ncbi:MAG: hypothetical protein IKM35_07155 [Bacteroidaceae bacterium]|nr:hypothetical protein [Bacteroidaceae bacterium]
MKSRVVNIALLIGILTWWVMTIFTSSNNKMVVNDCTTEPTQTTESLIVDASTIAFPDTLLCLPRTTTPIHIHLSQQSNKRNDTERRHNTSYLKSGKIIDTDVSLSIHKPSKPFCSVLSEPYHRLISLGRLII